MSKSANLRNTALFVLACFSSQNAFALQSSTDDAWFAEQVRMMDAKEALCLSGEISEKAFQACSWLIEGGLAVNESAVYTSRGRILLAWDDPQSATADFVEAKKRGAPDADALIAKAEKAPGWPVDWADTASQSASSDPADAEAGGETGGVAGTVDYCMRTPDAELVVFNAEVAEVKAAHPMPTYGAQALSQWMYAFSDEALGRLEPHKACLGLHYQANRAELEAARSSAKSSCEALASSAGECPNTYPR